MSAIRYSPEEKLEAIAQFYVCKTYLKTAKLTGISDMTIRDWVQSNDGQRILNEMREQHEEEFRNRAGELQTAVLEALHDRLENGNLLTKNVKVDGIYTKLEWREPVPTKELAYLLSVVTDKYRVSLNMPTKISRTQDGNTSMLEEFQKLTHDLREKKANAIEGETVN